jgi:aminomethyltransferase
MLRETPFHARTAPLCVSQAWRRWAGHMVASSYELHHEREYHSIRNSAALLDISPLYKYIITGRDAAKLLDRVITRDVAKMSPGQVYYTPWCDSAGKVIDDGTVARLDESRYRMTAADPNYRWLSENAFGMNVKIEDVSDATAALALQGPLSRTILEKLCERDLSGLKYFRLMTATARGIPVTISRTGYTGDLGYEIWVEASKAVQLWDALIEVGAPYAITPAGMLALDIARIEAGLMLLEVDYVSAHRALIEGQKSSPYELNLGWTVKLEKEFFVGRDALVAETQRESPWHFTGITVDWESLESLYAKVGLPPKLPGAAWRVSVPLYTGGDQVGYATSGTWSPFLKKYIALAHLNGPVGRVGSEIEMEVTVEHHRKRARAKVTQLPFFNPERKRA